MIPTNRILPKGYYLVMEGASSAFHTVKLSMGPWTNVAIEFADKIKIREDALTGTPQLLYNYKVVDFAKYNPRDVETSPSLSKIVAAIAVELLSEQLEYGATLESV
jgi:hypothetical protein